MNIQQLLNSTIALKAAMLIARTVPVKTGHKIAGTIAEYFADHKSSKLVRAIRLNQSVIRDFNVCEEELEIITHEVLRETSKCLFDFYHYLNFPEKILSLIEIDPKLQDNIDRVRNNQATIVVAPHTSNFDLMGCGLHLMGLDFQILSYPNPNDSYQLQNQIRRSFGLHITPFNFESFRAAKALLRNGGSVLTGMDRPINDFKYEKYRPRFFGYPASLPVAYIRLAIDLSIPVCVFACVRTSHNKYKLVGSDLIEMVEYDDLHETIIHNTESVLFEAEKIIKKYPIQWSMFYPIWEEKLFQHKFNEEKEVFQ